MRNLSIAACRRSDVQPLRALFLQEIAAQVRDDAAHGRRGTRWFLFGWDGRYIGYGAVKDTNDGPGTIFEFYVVPPFRHDARDLLRGLIETSRAGALECQTNDRFYCALVRELDAEPASDTVLFAAGQSNDLQVPDARVRRRRSGDRIFEHTVEPVGDFVVQAGGEIVGTGGFLLHYNPPFADLFMEVREDARRRGYGSFLIQELIRECYLAGRVPAARTSIDNIASQKTLAKGGLRECGRMLRVRRI
jgi:GNAT superfamily N-acetyltransferase